MWHELYSVGCRRCWLNGMNVWVGHISEVDSNHVPLCAKVVLQKFSFYRDGEITRSDCCGFIPTQCCFDTRLVEDYTSICKRICDKLINWSFDEERFFDNLFPKLFAYYISINMSFSCWWKGNRCGPTPIGLAWRVKMKKLTTIFSYKNKMNIFFMSNVSTISTLL